MGAVLHGCLSWLLFLKEEHKITQFYKATLRGISQSKRDAVPGDRTKLYDYRKYVFRNPLIKLSTVREDLN